MKKIAFVVFFALAVLAAAACQDNLTSPTAGAVSKKSNTTISETTASDTTTEITGYLGTWKATKAEAWRAIAEGGGWVEVVGSRRDLVAEGGTVTLVLEASHPPSSSPAAELFQMYTITVTMPGVKTGVDTGRWHYHQFWGRPQIDFYPSSLGPDPEYGEIPAFLVALSDNTLTLWDSGLTFLPFDFGWGTTPGMTGCTVLSLVFTRR